MGSMKKLYKLKNWYSLDDAAKRLTMTLGEDVSINDILQMAVERHLPLSWYMRHVMAREVAPTTKIYRRSECPFESLKLGNEKKEQPEVYYVSGYSYQTGVLPLDGIFTLALDESGALEDWILSFITNTGGNLVPLYGFFVRDEQNNLWQIMDSLSIEERKAYGLKIDHTKGVHHEDNFFPSAEFPKLADLGVTKIALEKFEAMLDERNTVITPNRPLNPKERESLLKLVLGMAIDGYGYNPKASRSPAASGIANDLKTQGISIDEDTVRKWLNEAKESIEIQAE
jgi:hypothetical protein